MYRHDRSGNSDGDGRLPLPTSANSCLVAFKLSRPSLEARHTRVGVARLAKRMNRKPTSFHWSLPPRVQGGQFVFTATTTIRRTAAACGTTFTCATSRMPTCGRSTIFSTVALAVRLIWLMRAAIRSRKCLRRPSRSVAAASRRNRSGRRAPPGRSTDTDWGATRAYALLGWRPKRSELEIQIADAWKWMKAKLSRFGPTQSDLQQRIDFQVRLPVERSQAPHLMSRYPDRRLRQQPSPSSAVIDATRLLRQECPHPLESREKAISITRVVGSVAPAAVNLD